MKRILAGEEYVEYDVEKVRKNGEKIICIMTATPFRRSDGELIGIVEDFKDITERKRNEELLNQAKVTRAERQRLFSLLDVLPAIVYLQSPNYSIPFANRTFRKLFGDPEHRPCYEILYGLKDPCEECRLNRILANRENGETERRGDGGTGGMKESQNWELTIVGNRVYEMYDNLFIDIDNSLMVLELGIDVTERIQMENARKDAERQLEEQRARAILSDRLRSLGEMGTGMAHELNQPLLGIRGLAEHMLLGFKRGWNIPEETIKEKIQLIIDQTDRMTHVIEHTRLFARGADNSELLPVQCNDAIKSCLGLIGAQLRFRGFNLNCDLAEGLPHVLANPFSLEEVFLNLINNARDALEEKKKAAHNRHSREGRNSIRPEDSLEVIIRTSEEVKEPVSESKEPVHMVKIEIIDRGAGIPQDLMPKVFDTFFTTKDPDKGTGLGLSISKSIIESYQGTITIQSTVGSGTTVTITLPALKQI